LWIRKLKNISCEQPSPNANTWPPRRLPAAAEKTTVRARESNTRRPDGTGRRWRQAGRLQRLAFDESFELLIYSNYDYVVSAFLHRASAGGFRGAA
jgi:hypothetical protein